MIFLRLYLAAALFWAGFAAAECEQGNPLWRTAGYAALCGLLWPLCAPWLPHVGVNLGRLRVEAMPPGSFRWGWFAGERLNPNARWLFRWVLGLGFVAVAWRNQPRPLPKAPAPDKVHDYREDAR